MVYLSVQLCPTLSDYMDYSPQVPLSMEFSRQECWSRVPFPPPRNLPDTGLEPTSLALAGRFFTTEPPGKPGNCYRFAQNKHSYL